MILPARVALLAMLSSAVAAGSGSGCTCASVNCTGPAVSVDLDSRFEAVVTQVCVNDICEVASETDSDDVVEVRFDTVPFVVRDNEDFELEITVFNEDGVAVASAAQTRNFDVDECRCLSFPYRLDGSNVERSD